MKQASILIVVATTASTAVAAAPSYKLQTIGLTGAGYQYAAGNGQVDRNISIQQENAAGQVIGSSARYNTAGTSLGQDVWLYNGTSTQMLGLSGDIYAYASTGSGGGTFRSSTVKQLNTVGQAAGFSVRFTASGVSLGQDAWLYTGATTQQIGLTGTGYEYAYTGAGGGTIRSSTPTLLNAAGQVAGSVFRYTAAGASLGEDAWVYDRTSTHVIGLTGDGYNYTYTGAGGGTYRDVEVQQMNATGQAVGTSYLYSGTGTFLGLDAWLYTGTTTQLIGLMGTDYQYAYSGSGGGTVRRAAAVQLNDAGQVTGNTVRYNAVGTSIGQDAWLYAGGATQVVGLTGNGYEYTSSGTGGGTVRYGSAQLLNAAGQAGGFTSRYTAAGTFLGQDTWVCAGNVTSMVGLTGGEYEYAPTGTTGATYRANFAQQLNATGQMIGYANRYNAAGTALGRDAWLSTGTTTRMIGLTGPGYEYTYTGTNADGRDYRYDAAQQVNAAGQVVGIADRFSTSGTNLGVDAWFFDGSTGVTTALSFGGSTSGYSYTTPAVLTDTGVVLGSYQYYYGASYGGTDAFMWSQAGGFSDLGSLVNGGLTAAGWKALASVYATDGATSNGSPEYIAGIGQTSDDYGGQDAFLLTAAPEPTSLTLLTGTALAALRRRRRNSFPV